MNPALKTYGIVINMDYEHHQHAICKALWDEISNNMRAEKFSFDKRMFVITTDLEKDTVYNKARQVLEQMEDYKETYEKRVFHYVKDFYAVDMTDYVDLTLPPGTKGITVEGLEIDEDIGVDVKFN
jgi:hypothetical protein